MPLPRINRAYLQTIKDPKEKAWIEAEIAKLEILSEEDPLQTFEPNCPEQEKFLRATTKTQAAFAGNQSGKTTALVVKCLIQCTPRERLPSHLREYKVTPEGPVFGRVVNPGAKQLSNTLLPTFRQWCPKHILLEGSFDKSWSQQQQLLRFNDGSYIDFLTYETDLDKFGGPQRHFLGYDEPPPRDIRDEGLVRLTRFGGFEMFAMTPLTANTGWIKRDVWRKRESPDITVAKWSIHDNKALDKKTVQYVLDSLPNDLWRRARELGDFVEAGGLIYPRFEDALLKDVPVDPTGAQQALQARVSQLDVVVGIDPGLRNAAFVWVGFDRDNRALVFDEVLLQQQYPEDYAKAIRLTNQKWNLKGGEITYVIDPAFRIRSQTNGENVESALTREGIYCVPGQNAVEAGVLEVGQRLNQGMLQVSPACVGLRDEADEYAMEDREDGVFKEVHDGSFHFCFVAGTLVETESGPCPIERIEVGERVWTRAGLRPVVAAAQSSPDAEVWALGPLVGTPDHPIWTENRGWARLDSLRYDDILVQWTDRSGSTERGTPASPVLASDLIASTSRASRTDSSAIYIEPCGNTTTGRSPKAGSFTTSTATRSTTSLTTLLRSLAKHTRTSTGRRSLLSNSAPTPLRSDHSRRLGTLLRKVGRGTANMAGRLGPSESPSLVPALSAALSSTASPNGLTTSSARTSASRRGGVRPASMTSSATASSAVSPSPSTSTPSRSAAPAPAGPSHKVGRSAVYNLTVSDAHEYFADGLLVSNCDALRYVCMYRTWTPYEEVQPQPLGWVPGEMPALAAFERRQPIGT